MVVNSVLLIRFRLPLMRRVGVGCFLRLFVSGRGEAVLLAAGTTLACACERVDGVSFSLSSLRCRRLFRVLSFVCRICAGVPFLGLWICKKSENYCSNYTFQHNYKCSFIYKSPVVLLYTFIIWTLSIVYF